MHERTADGNPSGLKRWFLYFSLASFVVGFGVYIQIPNLDDDSSVSTVLTEHEKSQDCIPPSINQFPSDIFTQEERQKGFVLLHICITGYLCLILAIVCDQFFVPALELISEYVNVPVDVAGATFMAIGTSSPELYSSVIGSFVTEGDIGIGTIVGSAVFNILGVTSVTGLLLWRTEAPVDWYPVSRDCFVYIFSIIALISIIKDNIVTRIEASVLLFIFVIYIAMLYYNEAIKVSCKEKMEDLHIWWKRYRKARSSSIRVRRTRTRSLTIPDPSSLNKDAVQTQQEEDSDSDDDMTPWTVPADSRFQFLLWLITWPVLVILTLTIPNCRKPNQHLFMFTFLSSVVWIGVISYLCSWMVTIIGFTFGLPDSVAGITILAAGISVPEIIASVIVVKNGMANMAFSNLIGSNIFDILFCLGLPWLIKTRFFSPGGELIIHSSALAYSAATLLTTVVLLFVVLSSAGWKLNWKVGLSCFGLYVAFLIVACLCEMNTFAQLNPPTCAL